MIIDVWQIKDELQLAILAAAIALGFWRGAGPERACAGIYLAMWSVDRLYHMMFGTIVMLGGADIGHIAIDAFSAFGLVCVALYANRNYTLWLASMQLVALLSHFLRIISPGIDPTAYALLMASPMYLAVMVFAIGIIRHMLRQQRHGPYRSWRDFSHRTAAPSWPIPSPTS